MLFPPGAYLYLGSACGPGGLRSRLERHLLGKGSSRPHWHIDALRAICEVKGVLAIRSSARLECGIASAMAALSDWTVPGFGSTDCNCLSHLFGMERDPVKSPAFQKAIQFFRMDRYREAPRDG